LKILQSKLERLLKSFDKRYARFMNTRFQQLPARTTPLGFRFLGNEAMETGSFEPEETRLVASLMAQVDQFVNIGANIGYYCCLALQKGLPVIAFEPEHNNLKVLLRNIRENAWNERIEIHPVALSDCAGIVDIYGSGTGASLLRGWANTPDHLVASIPASTLDLSLGARLQGTKTLILMDIEGAEYAALQGGLATLRQDPKPIWMVEICSHQHQPAGVNINPKLLQTFDLFWESGYTAYTASATPRVLQRSEVQAIAQGGADTLQLHNFIFIDQALSADTFFPANE
jgi:FkbM family methyltransferase